MIAPAWVAHRPQQERSLEALVADLEQVVRAYAPQGAIIVGHSYGGIMARLLTARQPQLVKALVLVDPSSEFVGAPDLVP